MEVTYWGFRMMIGFGGIAALAALRGPVGHPQGNRAGLPWLMRLAVFGILAPFGANAAGWIFTEMGRQPFVVAPNPDPSGIDQVFMFTAAAVSPGVSAGEILASLVVLTAVYAALLVVEVKLLVKYIRGGVVSAMPELAHAPADENEDQTPGTGPARHRQAGRRRPGLRLLSTRHETQRILSMELLPTIWFIAIAVLWTGYLFLEGFDLGVGMLMKRFARDNTERRVLLNTIGPVWDGNEVWLMTAGAATFAAFPLWYASLFSALYLPLLVVLVALIFRAVAFEYRGKVDTPLARPLGLGHLAGLPLRRLRRRRRPGADHHRACR